MTLAPGKFRLHVEQSFLASHLLPPCMQSLDPFAQPDKLFEEHVHPSSCTPLVWSSARLGLLWKLMTYFGVFGPSEDAGTPHLTYCKKENDRGQRSLAYAQTRLKKHMPHTRTEHSLTTKMTSSTIILTSWSLRCPWNRLLKVFHKTLGYQY